MNKLLIGIGSFAFFLIPTIVGQWLADWLAASFALPLLINVMWWLITAVILTVLAIVAWALYHDKLWQGLMFPISFFYTLWAC